MATVYDVVRYIISKVQNIQAMKLQKLVYYCQAWSLVWDDEPLFNEEIQAWAQGPVIPALYNCHRGQFKVDFRSINGKLENLTETQKDTINAVLDKYGDKTSQWLSDLTHMEEPWKKARSGMKDGDQRTKCYYKRFDGRIL